MAARWVRDTLDAFVSITPGYPNGGGLKWFWSLAVLKEDHIEYPMQKEDECLLTEEIASTYELAMEDGIRAALNLL